MKSFKNLVLANGHTAQFELHNITSNLLELTHLCFLSRGSLALIPCLTPWTITSCTVIPSYQLIAAAQQEIWYSGQVLEL